MTTKKQIMPPLYSHWLHKKYKFYLVVRTINGNNLILKDDHDGLTWKGTLEEFCDTWVNKAA